MFNVDRYKHSNERPYGRHINRKFTLLQLSFRNSNTFPFPRTEMAKYLGAKYRSTLTLKTPLFRLIFYTFLRSKTILYFAAYENLQKKLYQIIPYKIVYLV